MAYGDLSIFRPSDAQYSNPAQALTAVKGEATQRAAYLSSMDQFYAQMEEAGRQFDITTQQTREMFGEELAFKGKELQAQEKYWEEQIAFGREQLGSEQERWQAQLAEERRYHDQAFDLGKEDLKLRTSNLDLEKEKLALEAEINLPISVLGVDQSYGLGGFGKIPILGRDATPWGGRKVKAPVW